MERQVGRHLEGDDAAFDGDRSRLLQQRMAPRPGVLPDPCDDGRPHGLERGEVEVLCHRGVLPRRLRRWLGPSRAGWRDRLRDQRRPGLRRRFVRSRRRRVRRRRSRRARSGPEGDLAGDVPHPCLEAIEAGGNGVDVRCRFGAHKPQKGQFDDEPLLAALAKVEEGV